MTRLVGDDAVRAVELDDGTTLEADLVVVGIGVQPVTEFVRGVELDPDGGLPVDGRLRVAPGVWAAGDVARYREPHTGSDVRIEHWRLAEQHGRAAAADIAGKGEPFAGVPFFWTQHFDLELGYAGAGQGGRRSMSSVTRLRATSRPSTRAETGFLPPAARSVTRSAPSSNSCARAGCRQRRTCAGAPRPALRRTSQGLFRLPDTSATGPVGRSLTPVPPG